MTFAGIQHRLKKNSSLLYDFASGFPTARSMTRPQQDWSTIVDFVNGYDYGLLATLQVKSELLAALNAVEKHRPATVLEIGTARGGTMFLFTRAAMPDAHFVSVDLPGGLFGGNLVPSIMVRNATLNAMALPRQKLTFVSGDSHQPDTLNTAAKHLNDRAVDFLFIDGDHSYDGVKRDFEMYSKLVRPGGLVIFHDVAEHPASTGCEVRRYWNELRTQYPSEEVIERMDQGWAGIGILHL